MKQRFLRLHLRSLTRTTATSKAVRASMFKGKVAFLEVVQVGGSSMSGFLVVRAG